MAQCHAQVHRDVLALYMNTAETGVETGAMLQSPLDDKRVRLTAQSGQQQASRMISAITVVDLPRQTVVACLLAVPAVRPFCSAAR